MALRFAARQSNDLEDRFVDVQVSFSTGAFLTRARIRPTTSLARLSALMMRSNVWRASSKSGGWAASQRKPDAALVTTAVTGWLTSWAIEAVCSPRARQASDARELRLRLLESHLRPFALSDVHNECPSCRQFGRRLFPVPAQEVHGAWW